ELIKRLEQLAHYRKMGEKLWGLPKKNHQFFVRPRISRREIIKSLNLPGDINSLAQSYISSLRKEQRKFAMVKKDRISLKEKIMELKEILTMEKSTTFEKIIEKSKSSANNNLVITFIALLELARLGKVNIFQNKQYGCIYIDMIGSMHDLNADMIGQLENMDAAMNIQ
ncbi:MAG: segregation/condensation protein A, partial [Halobacteriovoraceae bacterium]|nr:segregation/condensation protein A [Halobacteriovoraceae bacterium]